MARKHLAAGNRVGLTVLASSISAIVAAGGIQTARAQEEDAATPEEVIRVTGSRIERRDLSAASPIMTVEAERFDMSSTISVETVLNQMPQFIPDQDQFDAQGNIQTSPTASLGIGTASLRGVQSNRTLVLLDGRRAQPANAALVVDLNSIPAAAIERVETITGGASAVYGADALAGVVNFVLRDDFEGISIDVQTGFTQEGDGEEVRFTSLLGMNSESGTANLMLGVEWYEREVVLQRDRDFYVDGWYDSANNLTTFFPSMAGYAVDPNNLPEQTVVDGLFGPGVVDVATPNLVFFFNPDGTPYVRIGNTSPGFDDSALGLGYTGDGDYGLVREPGGALEQVYMNGAFSTPMERRSAFGKAHVDFTDNMRAFVQANFSRIEVDTYSAGPPPAVGGAWGASIPNDGRTAIPPALQDLLTSRTTNSAANWQLNRGLDFLGQFGPVNTTDIYQIMAGVEGEFENRDWTWEAYVSSGQTNVQNLYVSMPSVDKWQALAALPEFGEGTVQAFPDVFGYGLNCTSGLPIFDGGTATMTDDCRQSLLSQYKTTTVVDQDILEANLQGKLLDMSAGELRFAAGISTRENGYDYSPASPQSAVFDRPLGIFPSNAANGETSVNEIYGELLVPVVERLSLELGYRYSDYDTAAGSVGTYKALFDWAATDWMRLRGGYQLANRAPNSAELFQSGVVVFSVGFVGDPCQTNTLAPYGNVPTNPNRAQTQQLCGQLINDPAVFGPPGSASADNFIIGTPGDPPFTGINGIQAGNTELESEEADTYTIGVVFQGPGDLEGLTASIDYYSIEIEGAIGSFNANTVYAQCFNANGISNPGYTVNDPLGFCGLINRGQAGATGTVDLTFLNTGLIDTAGIDLGVNWSTNLSTGGTLYVNSVASFLDKFNTQEKPGDPIFEWKDTLGQGGQFKYRLNTTVGYNFAGGNAGVGLRLRHLPEIRSADVVMVPNTTTLPTKSHNNLDLFASYNFNERYQLRGGIDNVLNEDPAVVGATPVDSNSNNTLPSYYDVLGRRMYVGVKMLF